MIASAPTASKKTVALPAAGQGLAPIRPLSFKSGRAMAGEGNWVNMIYGPYLVPVARRVE
jgi:hypothetical protein